MRTLTAVGIFEQITLRLRKFLIAGAWAKRSCILLIPRTPAGSLCYGSSEPVLEVLLDPYICVSTMEKVRPFSIRQGDKRLVPVLACLVHLVGELGILRAGKEPIVEMVEKTAVIAEVVETMSEILLGVQPTQAARVIDLCFIKGR